MSISKRKPGLIQGIIIGLIAIMLISFLMAGILTWIGGGHIFSADMPTEIQEKRITIPVEGAKQAEISLSVGAGTILIQQSSSNGPDKLLFDATVRSTNEAVSRINTSVTGDTAYITLTPEKGEYISVSPEEERWEITLNPDIPIRISLSMGEGETRAYLRGMNLTGLNVGTGTGISVVELSDLKQAYLPVSLKTGIGHTEVILTKNANITANIKNGIGDTSITGLSESGEKWQHSSDLPNASQITLTLEQGIGDVRVYTL